MRTIGGRADALGKGTPSEIAKALWYIDVRYYNTQEAKALRGLEIVVAIGNIAIGIIAVTAGLIKDQPLTALLGLAVIAIGSILLKD